MILCYDCWLDAGNSTIRNENLFAQGKVSNIGPEECYKCKKTVGIFVVIDVRLPNYLGTINSIEAPENYRPTVIGEYFLIRHKQSGEYMPQAKKNRGYTHWNPSNQTNPFTAALPFPRLLASKKMAIRCIAQWVSMPNAKHSFSTSSEGHEDDSLDTKDDGRTKEDLEIVEVQLVLK